MKDPTSSSDIRWNKPPPGGSGPGSQGPQGYQGAQGYQGYQGNTGGGSGGDLTDPYDADIDLGGTHILKWHDAPSAATTTRIMLDAGYYWEMYYA